MLEGLEVTEVTLQHLIGSAETLRFDPEYFQKAHLHDETVVEDRQSEFKLFKDLKLTVDASAFYPSIEPYYDTGEMPFLRVADVDSVIDLKQCTRIPSPLCDEFPTLKKVFPGDIVLTKGGSVARIGLVMQEAVACRDLIFINSSKLPEMEQVFLYLYFQTSFCNRWLIRSSSQTAQPHLTITLVRNLPIFTATTLFKQRCVKMVQESYRKREESLKAYKQAEQTLLRSLGLENWQPPEPLTYVRKASEAFAAGRLDAEHFQPKYEELIDKLSKIKNLTLRHIKEFSKPLKYGTSENLIYTEEGVPFLRIADLQNKRFDSESVLHISPAQAATLTEKVTTGDVLISRSGTLGVAVPIPPAFDGAIYGSYFIRTKPNPRIIHPEYLALFLNSLTGQMQVEQKNTGGIQTNLTIDAIENLLIPVGSLEWQEQFVSLVEESLDARQQARTLLNRAKRAVEIAIEESEEKAMRFLEGVN